MGSEACRHYIIRGQILQACKCILNSNSKGEEYLASHKGPEELGIVCFQDKNENLKLRIRIFSLTWTSHTFTSSNLLFYGHVLITCALPMHQRCTMRRNYVQTKLPNGQWKQKFQLFFSNLFTSFLMFSIFRAYWFLIDSFRQKNNRKLMERIKDAWAIFFTPECDYNL